MNYNIPENPDIDLIIKTFSYSKQEQRSFKYISQYMKIIKPFLNKEDKDQAFINRFMTIGLFLTYRLCNHDGTDFSTNMDMQQLPDEHRQRMHCYLKFGGEPFDNTAEYLRKIPAMTDSPGETMAKYVIG